MAFVKDEDNPLVAEMIEPLLEHWPPLSSVLPVLPAVLVKSKPELLDGGDDDFVRIVVGLESSDKRLGVGVFLDAIFLKPVELLSGLAVQILTVNDEKAFVDALVGFKQCRGLEGG